MRQRGSKTTYSAPPDPGTNESAVSQQPSRSHIQHSSSPASTSPGCARVCCCTNTALNDSGAGWGSGCGAMWHAHWAWPCCSCGPCRAVHGRSCRRWSSRAARDACAPGCKSSWREGPARMEGGEPRVHMLEQWALRSETVFRTRKVSHLRNAGAAWRTRHEQADVWAEHRAANNTQPGTHVAHCIVLGIHQNDLEILVCGVLQTRSMHTGPFGRQPRQQVGWPPAARTPHTRAHTYVRAGHPDRSLLVMLQNRLTSLTKRRH